MALSASILLNPTVAMKKCLRNAISHGNINKLTRYQDRKSKRIPNNRCRQTVSAFGKMRSCQYKWGVSQQRQEMH